MTRLLAPPLAGGAATRGDVREGTLGAPGSRLLGVGDHPGRTPMEPPVREGDVRPP